MVGSTTAASASAQTAAAKQQAAAAPPLRTNTVDVLYATDEQRHHLERLARTQLIDARVPSGFIGHAYFYRHPAVSADLILLLRDGLEPGSPGRPFYKRGSNFWQITPDYPNVSDTPSR